MKETENLKVIRDVLRKEGFDTPIIADVHFNPAIAELAAHFVEKAGSIPGITLIKKGSRTIPPIG